MFAGALIGWIMGTLLCLFLMITMCHRCKRITWFNMMILIWVFAIIGAVAGHTVLDPALT